MANYIFIDESGDPGQPFIKVETGNKVPTGASMFYILSAVCLSTDKLFELENDLTEIRAKYGFRSELKSTIVPLTLYKDVLALINELEIPIYYRLTERRVENITHVSSEYVNAMQLSDLINGAIKDYHTGKNKNLIKTINKKYLYKIY